MTWRLTCILNPCIGPLLISCWRMVAARCGGFLHSLKRRASLIPSGAPTFVRWEKSRSFHPLIGAYLSHVACRSRSFWAVSHCHPLRHIGDLKLGWQTVMMSFRYRFFSGINSFLNHLLVSWGRTISFGRLPPNLEMTSSYAVSCLGLSAFRCTSQPFCRHPQALSTEIVTTDGPSCSRRHQKWY